MLAATARVRLPPPPPLAMPAAVGLVVSVPLLVLPLALPTPACPYSTTVSLAAQPSRHIKLQALQFQSGQAASGCERAAGVACIMGAAATACRMEKRRRSGGPGAAQSACTAHHMCALRCAGGCRGKCGESRAREREEWPCGIHKVSRGDTGLNRGAQQRKVGSSG